MRKYPILALVLAFVLGACQSTPPPAPVVAAPAVSVLPADDTCGAATLASFIGEHRDRLPPTPAGTVRRVVCSTCPMTMDFNASRLNVIYDDKTGVVSKLTCG